LAFERQTRFKRSMASPTAQPRTACITRSLLLKEIPSSYPFATALTLNHDPTREYFHVQFNEFHSCGPPSGELGSPGDVYFDTTAKGTDLYGRLDAGWEKHTDLCSVIAHPFLPHYRLLRGSMPFECYWVCFENFPSKTTFVAIRAH